MLSTSPAPAPSKKGLAKQLEPFVCGGSAATFASVIIHPIDLAKVRMQLYGQLNPGKPIPSFVTILSNMVKHDGFFSIYKGVDAAIGRQLVYGTARIGLHRKFSDKLVRMILLLLSRITEGFSCVFLTVNLFCCVLCGMNDVGGNERWKAN
ncbi:MAG: hypothetical protein SGARI_007158 [Bacillariaceae sp.]